MIPKHRAACSAKLNEQNVSAAFQKSLTTTLISINREMDFFDQLQLIQTKERKKNPETSDCVNTSVGLLWNAMWLFRPFQKPEGNHQIITAHQALHCLIFHRQNQTPTSVCLIIIMHLLTDAYGPREQSWKITVHVQTQPPPTPDTCQQTQ